MDPKLCEQLESGSYLNPELILNQLQSNCTIFKFNSFMLLLILRQSLVCYDLL